MKRLVVLLVLSLTTSVQAFEIKPICTVHHGAMCSHASSSELKFKKTNFCKYEKLYAALGWNHPVHEVITRQAYKKVFGELVGENYKQPLIGGVEWNDDPEVLVRKVVYEDGFDKVKKFPKNLKDEKAMTYRTHYGDMQFLHAMKSDADQDDQKVKQQIYDWIKNAYAVTTGKIKYDQDIEGTYFSKYFSKESVLKYEKISDIFDPHKTYRNDERLEKRTRLFASGSILHLIQDSYSKSHTDRNSTEKIKFKHYPNSDEVHCSSDVPSIANKKEIEKATEMSVEYLKLRKRNADWCEVANFIKKDVFYMTNIEDDSCPM